MSHPTPDASPHELLAHAARAAQDLAELLWRELHEQLAASHSSQQLSPRVSELAQRLSQVTDTVALLARAHTSPSAPAPVSSAVPPAPHAAPPAPHAAAPQSGQILAYPTHAAPSGPMPSQTPPSPPPSFRQAPDRAEEQVPAVIVDEHLEPLGESPPAAAIPTSPPEQPGPAIHIHDERSSLSPSPSPQSPPWLASVERRLERYARDGLPFAVLLLELVDLHRLRHAELPGEFARLVALVEAALAGQLRPADSLMRETPGRYWLLAPETDTPAAKHLAARLAGAVRVAASHRGAPLVLAAGIAICPQDGRQASALLAQADIALYAAQSLGAATVPNGS